MSLQLTGFEKAPLYCSEIYYLISSVAVQAVLKSLDDPRTAGLILEEQANALKSILGDASVLKLVRVRH